MGSSALFVVWIAASSLGATIPETETEQQNAAFQRLWNDDFVWRFDDLPAKGSVPTDRIPYSGHIYLDKHGGTTDALRKYDRAFNNNGLLPATSWEYGDTSEARRSRTVTVGRGLFGSRTTRTGINHWYGHCNGWSSAAIRHAEPQHSVTAYGVEFTPADIKGLLAEIYMYNEHEVLAGLDEELNPGTLHAILANWIGRGSHAIVMDSDPGEEKWNYPIYSFASSSTRQSRYEVDVRTNIYYAKDTQDREYHRSPRIHKMKSFHYRLHLNQHGEITGGYYYRDSDRIDFVWIPLQPKLSGEEGNEAGNPHVDVARVLEIWRKSVSREARRGWLIVDPSEADRAVEVPDPNRILPRNIRIVAPELPVEPIVRNDAAPANEVQPDSGTDADQDLSANVEAPPRVLAGESENELANTNGQPAANDALVPAVTATQPPAEEHSANNELSASALPNTTSESRLTDADILSILNSAANRIESSN